MHTLGNWEIAMIDGGAAPCEIVSEIGSIVVNIAQVFPPCSYAEMGPDGKGGSVELATYQTSASQVEANARLIAAAPSLLKALQSVVVLASADTASLTNRMNEAARIARFAIAKAEGRIAGASDGRDAYEQTDATAGCCDMFKEAA